MQTVQFSYDDNISCRRGSRTELDSEVRRGWLIPTSKTRDQYSDQVPSSRAQHKSKN